MMAKNVPSAGYFSEARVDEVAIESIVVASLTV
jgi:hypothetical protein